MSFLRSYWSIFVILDGIGNLTEVPFAIAKLVLGIVTSLFVIWCPIISILKMFSKLGPRRQLILMGGLSSIVKNLYIHVPGVNFPPNPSINPTLFLVF